MKTYLKLISVLLLGAFFFIPQTALGANANKRVTSTGSPFAPGSNVNLQIEVPYPDEFTYNTFEVVFVIDSSHSMISDVNYIKQDNGPLMKFVDDLAAYPADVQVGIVSFGYKSGSGNSTDWHPNTIFNLTDVNTATARQNLKNAIKNIQVSTTQGVYSDLHRGMALGNGLFQNDPSSGRIMVVLTDGLHNFPGPGSTVWGHTGWNGQCAINRSNGNLNVSNPKFNYIAVVPGGNHSLRLDGSFDDTPVGGYRYNSPCNYPFGAGPTGYDFMGQMITGAQQIGITGERSANADSVFEFINRVLTPVRMNMHDTINGSVFEKINSASVPVNCATGQPFILDLGSLGQFQQGSTEVIGPPATAKELHSEVLLVPENVRVCVNFNAKIRADASSQLYAINTASNNYVRFYNIFNQVISNSSVNSGTISVQGAGDLDIVEFWLTDSTGTRKSNFKSDEAIYVHVKIRNIGAGPVNAGADTSIWKKGNLGVGVSSDIPMYFNNHPSWAAGQERTFVSRAGGVTGNSSWIESAPGSYVAKALTNWDNTIPESNKNNNSATTSYSIEQRADLSAVSLLLNDADSDVSKRVFAMNEPIYINAQMRNLTPQVMPGTVTTTFFKTQTATVAAGTWTDIPSSINVSNWPASQTLHFRSRPGSSTASSFVGNTSWLAGDNETGTANDGPGDFVARMHVNYRQDAGPVDETNYTNNQLAIGYSAVTVPEDLAPSSLNCQSVTLRWTPSSSNVTNYSLRLRRGSSSWTTHSNIGRRTSYPVSGLTPNSNYTWQIAVHTQHGMSDWFPGGTFSTPACPAYTTSVQTPITVIPGDIDVNGNGQVNISYLPGPIANATQVWNSQGARLRVAIVGIVAGDAPNACSSFSADGAPFTGNVDGLSARRTPRTTYPNIAHRDNIAPPTSPVSFDIVAADSTDPGLYTVCIGTTSPQSFVQASGADKLRGVVVRVQLRPWIQIDRPDGSSTSKSGDVHSNGQLDVYIPVNEYFFKSGTAGVVSAANTIQHIQNDRLVSTGLSRWRIPNYSSRVQTRSFDSLLALARSAQENPNAEFPSQLPTTGNLNSLCAQGAKVYHYRGNWTRSGNLDMSNAPQCANANLVFFVDGNVTHNGNVIDGTNGGTITFIVQGNISVNPNVTRLDGVHIFSGRFDSGTRYVENSVPAIVDNQLTVNGSLIGLSGASPNSTSGSFLINASTSGLQRNLGLGNSTAPAERIVYQPKYLYTLRELLGTSTYSWNE